MCSYLEITAHTIAINLSFLLCFKRFTGSHTAENISDAFHDALDKNNLKHSDSL